MLNQGRISALLLVASLCLGVSGCKWLFGGGSSKSGGGTPVVNVNVKNTDCPVSGVKLTVKVEQDNSGGALHLNITVNATCNGASLKGATLIATIPGETSTTTLTTDASGDASTSPQNPGNHDLIGQTVGIAVQGDDGKSYPQGSATVVKAP